jgi:hypothetical protein
MVFSFVTIEESTDSPKLPITPNNMMKNKIKPIKVINATANNAGQNIFPKDIFEFSIVVICVLNVTIMLQ